MGRRRSRYGIALAGGGTRGAAHVGVLLALEEAGLLPCAIAGTSAGAIVAGLYAAGLTPCELKEQVQLLTRRGNRLIDPDYGGIVRSVGQFVTGRPVSLQGLIKGKRLEQYLCSLTGGKAIRDTRLPTILPAVDIETGDTIAYTSCPHNTGALPHVRWEGDMLLCRAMRASAAVPAVFRPVADAGMCLVDGGITDNLPVDLLLASGIQKVLAVDVSEAYEPPERCNIIEVASHSLTIMTSRLREHMTTGEKLLLRPPLPEQAGLLTFARMMDCVAAGYEATRGEMATIAYLFG